MSSRILNNKVSVVIPSYNGKDLLEKYLDSVFGSLSSGDEVVVVDDSSKDETVSWLITKFSLKKIDRDINSISGYTPDINKLEYQLYGNNIQIKKKNIKLTLVSQLINLRFGASANVGVLLSSNPLVFLLNNDVKPTKDVVNQLRQHFDKNNKLFAVGCLEYENNVNGEKKKKNKLWFAKGIFQHSKAENFVSGETAWASGGSAMFSKDKYLRLKGFDKLFYPAYWEDIDLSFRARKKGWQVLFDEKAVVFHRHETTNKTVFGQDKINKMSWDNGQKFAWKNTSLWQKFFYILYKPYWYYQSKKHSNND